MSNQYHNKPAIDCMVENVPTASPKMTVGELQKQLTEHARHYASVAYVYLVSSDRVLVGVVSIKEIFTHSPQTLLAVIAKKTTVYATTGDTAEGVALLAIDHNLKAVPVVDVATKRLLGVVTPDVIMDILHHGRTRDALRRAGTESFDDAKESLLSGTPLLHIRKRLPWLLLGLFGGLIAAMIVRHFEAELATELLIVAFIPLVVYLADAVGSQTEIIFVRAIALEPQLAEFKRFRSYFAREMIVSFALASILGCLMIGLTSWWFVAPELSGMLFIAIIVTLLFSTIVALVIPYIAVRLRYDPALTSGPVATVIRDVLTLVLYFVVVGVHLRMF